MILNSAFERGDYDWLYANYLDENHGLLGEAVRAVGEEIDAEVAIDLCAGTGVMTFQLVDLQIPRVFAVDSSRTLLSALRRKIKPLGLLYSNVTTVSMDLNHDEALSFLKNALPSGHRADLITCRQAVGYLSQRTLSLVPELLAPGGRFLFNTFIEPPKGQVWFHRRSGGIAEAGFYAFGRVFHLQARWPRVDATVFTWHDVEGVLKPLWEKSGYRVNVSQHGRTLIVEVHRPHDH